MAKFVGLNTCLPFTRIRNLLTTASTAASTARSSEFVRKSRHSERPEIQALRGSKRGSFQTFVHANCVRSTEARIAMALCGKTSKSSQIRP